MAVPVNDVFSLRALLVAAIVSALFYSLFILVSLSGGDKAVMKLEKKLSSQVIALESPFKNGRASSTEWDHQNTRVEKTGLHDPLPAAPFDGLTEKHEFGLLPRIGANNLEPFDAYKKPFTVDLDRPSIALGVRGIGFSENLSNDVFQVLSPHTSILLSPYIPDVDALQKEARQNGYEVWLEVPFETQDFPQIDPGPLGILAYQRLELNQSHYKRILSMTSGYAGIASYTDGAFMNSKPLFDSVLGDAFRRGLGFLELNKKRDTLSFKMATSAGAPFVRPSLYAADYDLQTYFLQLKRLAKRNGRVVGVLDISPALLAEYQSIVRQAEAEGFQMIPLSAAVDRF